MVARNSLSVIYKSYRQILTSFSSPGRTQKGRKFSIDPRLNATNIVRQVKYESCVNDLIKVLNKLLSYMEDKDQHLNQPQGEKMASCSQLSVDINNEDGVHDVVHMMLCLLGKNEFEEKVHTVRFLWFMLQQVQAGT